MPEMEEPHTKPSAPSQANACHLGDLSAMPWAGRTVPTPWGYRYMDSVAVDFSSLHAV